MKMISAVIMFATICCLFFLYLSWRNKKTLVAYTFSPQPLETPFVSVIIPARNEEKNIAACLDTLLSQDYPNYEILVIDDNSTDRTWEIISLYQKKDPRVHAFKGQPLPEGWVGKQYACQQLIEKASGDYLLFTDADTRHSPQSISWAVTNILKHQADFMSGYLNQLIGSLGEALVVPAMYLMTTILLPLWKVPEKNHQLFSFAIGQFMICKRSSVLAIGGYQSFKDSLVEDMSLARKMKEHGFKTVFVDGKDYISCRMYHSFREAFRGYVKCLFGTLNQSFILILGLILFLFAVIELPFLHLAHQLYTGGDQLLIALVPVGLFSGLWFLVLRDRKVPPLLTLTYPLLFFMIMVLGFSSALTTGLLSGVDWKGRRVKCRPHPRPRTARRPVFKRPLKRINGQNIYPLQGLTARFTFWLTFAIVILFDLLFLHLRVKGRKNLRYAKDGALLVSNHSLYLDPAIIAHAIAPRRTFFTALAETFNMPFVGPYIRLLGAFPVSDKLPFRCLIEITRELLAQKRLVHFFPEGNLLRLNRDLQPFKEGVFYLAWLFNKPIIPIVIKSIPKKSPIKIIFKYRVEVTICQPIWPEDFKICSSARNEALQAMSGYVRKTMSEILCA